MAKYDGKNQIDVGAGGGGMGSGAGNISSGRMGTVVKDRQYYADQLAKAKELSKQADKKTFEKSGGIPPAPKRNIAKDMEIGSRSLGGNKGRATSRAPMLDEYKKGGKVKSYAKGGGCEIKGKTKGRMV